MNAEINVVSLIDVMMLLMVIFMIAGSIKAIAERRGRDGVYVRGDERAAYGQIMRVLDAARAAGVENVGLVTQPEPSPR